MNLSKSVISKIIFAIFLIAVVISCNSKKDFDPTAFVDPNIGGVGHILQPTRPTVQLPNQMIRMYPNRKDYLDDQISSFPLSLISHRNGQLFRLMPFVGNMQENVNPVSSWDQQNETATPYYYLVWLEDYNATLEFVPGAKTGFFRIEFPESAQPKLNLSIVNSGSWIQEDKNSISGVESFKGMKAYVFGEFDAPILSSQQLNNDKKLVLTFLEKSENNMINFKYGMSFISLEQAKKNLDNEMPDWMFDKYKNEAQKIWAETLGQIEVVGGSESRKRTFYTALYRCYERMNNITEDGKYYSNYDGKIHEDEQDFYIDDWVWDSYLTHHPLRALLDPDLENDMMASYVRMYEQSGWMPQFCLLWGENPCMNGFHSTITFLDNYRKNVLQFDMNSAYDGMKKNALNGTMLPWKIGAAGSLDSLYHVLNYFPALHPGELET
ncbi:MAG: glycoside hydrolase family 92 protein, partial [Prolixibacteraceae bacterium]|nr:glycoside hydrolase family 92 protein [Prolixibacteraceae bacterium]